MKAVVIVSGGMDSVTLAHMLKHDNPSQELHLVSFDYGQRHVRELEFAGLCSKDLDAKWDCINMSFLGRLFEMAGSESSLINSNVDVPHGHYEEESMKATVVPNRNAIMLSIATGIAVSEKAEFVYTGVHAGDHAIYPDCRPEFISAMDQAMYVANKGFAVDGFAIQAPFIHMNKYEIASIGDRLKVDWTATWSCYEGGELHCGKCGTCTERREAFSLAGVIDPTEYQSLV